VIFETKVFHPLPLPLPLLSLASGESDLPNADQVVGVACEEGLSVCGPGEGGARRSLGLGGRGEDFWLEFVHDDFTFQIPDLDRSAGGGAEPVSVGREGEGVDGVAAVEGVEVFSLVEIPQHRLAVFAARRAQRTVRRHRHRVQVARVADVVRLQLAVGQIPHLDQLVPAGRHDDGIGVGGGETDARDPFRVTVLLNGVLADTEGVPQLDGAVTRTGHDLSVVGGKRDAENVLSVTDESPGRRSHRQIPQAQGRVPRAGQGELSVRGQHDVRHKVSVTLESFVRDSVVGVVLSQLPDDDGLVTRR